MKDVQQKLVIPKDLQKRRILFARMNLSTQEKQQYIRLLKGHEGEKQFYQLIKNNHTTNSIFLHDLLLQSNNSLFQIDHILIHAQTIFSFEVKNYEGEFIIENGNWYVKSTKQEIRNPLNQLNKSDYLLRQLVINLGYNLPVKSYLVFINRDFTLYQLPPNLPILLRSQLNRFIQFLNKSHVPLKQEHHQLAQDLKKVQITDSSFENLPDYDFKQLRKGITCPECYMFLSRERQSFLLCDNCGYTETLEKGILRNVFEFHLLFPDMKITTNVIYEWCHIFRSPRTIRKVLSKHFIFIQNGPYSYYDIRP
ncbi:hypothetical protein HNQ35_000239 [Cerasibacillus quisquiliarum]|uniref:nuclease-related domain-containing protein n=1 Tax=Cerasibacillus quisquiliarum TaxID=227865 RepID=UPI001476FAC1|nr:nuclease-related domain-containing protein [Cerasibacillus quisquiliarum]MBB5145050.1 hypothetical protein [Cerasibacillus quisquiliarum]